MSDENVEPESGKPQLMRLDLPTIQLAELPIAIGPHPADPSFRAITIGPLFLVLPLDEDSKAKVVQGLTGIQVVGADAAPNGLET